jgi:acetyl esterase/lipase
VLLWSLRGIGVFLVTTLIVINVTPWPGAMLIRYLFESGAADVKEAMEKHAPEGVASILDEPYRPGDDDARLDVHFPEATPAGARLPTFIWLHGGAWISGHRDDATPYFQLIASEGYTVVSIGYSIAPEHQYPLPLIQVNDALAWIARHADRLHVDPERIVLAGDSSGAQIATQVAALVTDPAYATALDMSPSLQPEALRGLVLFCGIYDMEAFTDGEESPGWLLEWGVNTVLWAYTGSRDTDSPALREMSTIDHVTPAFPPAYISGGNADPLTDRQSRPFANRLTALGIDTTERFFPEDHEPELGHEYQLTLDNADGQTALQDVLTFMRQHTRASSP